MEYIHLGSTIIQKHSSQFRSIEVLVEHCHRVGPGGWNGNDSGAVTPGQGQEFFQNSSALQVSAPGEDQCACLWSLGSFPLNRTDWREICLQD